MKELSVEQKAKAYDEAIRKAKDMLNYKEVRQEDVEYLFPELKESEDERIRKMLIEQMERWHECALENNVAQDIKDSADAIAWLEKQGENTYNKVLSELLHKVICTFINDPDIPYSDREKVSMEVLPYVERLEKQGEQNLIMAKSPQLGELKPTWSKEDEANLNEALSYIKDDALKEFIKSLRPQRNVGYNPYKAVVESITKMVKKYESIISNKVDAVDFLNEVRAKCNEAKQYDVKYPQLQWKPSEEHIYWLKWAINRMPDTEKANEAEAVLEDLLEQLKQL